MKRLVVEIKSLENEITSLRDVLHTYKYFESADSSDECKQFLKRGFRRNEEHDMLVEGLRIFLTNLTRVYDSQIEVNYFPYMISFPSLGCFNKYFFT